MQRIWTKIRVPVSLGLFILFINKNELYNRIFPPARNFGVTFNSERKSIGINILPEAWITKNKYDNRQVWHPQLRPNKGTFRDTKEIIVESGNIIYDGDIYFKICGQQWEKLSVGYMFNESINWEFNYYNSVNGGVENKISQFQSDSILKSWSLEYK